MQELLEGGANPDESNYYSTPLLVASEEGYTDIAEVGGTPKLGGSEFVPLGVVGWIMFVVLWQVLLKYGAIPNDRTFRNESPIYLAVCAGKPGIVKVNSWMLQIVHTER